MTDRPTKAQSSTAAAATTGFVKLWGSSTLNKCVSGRERSSPLAQSSNYALHPSQKKDGQENPYPIIFIRTKCFVMIHLASANKFNYLAREIPGVNWGEILSPSFSLSLLTRPDATRHNHRSNSGQKWTVG